MANRLEERFVKADSRNLPKVDIFMVYEYISTDDRFDAPEIRGVKATRYNLFTYTFKKNRFFTAFFTAVLIQCVFCLYGFIHFHLILYQVIKRKLW